MWRVYEDKRVILVKKMIEIEILKKQMNLSPEFVKKLINFVHLMSLSYFYPETFFKNNNLNSMEIGMGLQQFNEDKIIGIKINNTYAN